MNQFEYVNATVGYHHCSCLDCFDQYVGGIGELCALCEEAGCEPLNYCQREDVEEEYIYRSWHRKDCPQPWFHTNPGHVCPE